MLPKAKHGKSAWDQASQQHQQQSQCGEPDRGDRLTTSRREIPRLQRSKSVMPSPIVKVWHEGAD